MAATQSSDMPIGSTAPDFTLPDARNNQPVTLSNLEGRPVLIVFMCNHCPYVLHMLDALIEIANTLSREAIATIAISANDIVSYPQDSPVKMAELASARNFEFPYCFDEEQTVARAYGAVCTPELFLLDASHRLYYHGQFDDTRPGGAEAHGSDLRQAATALLKGLPAPTDSRPSAGCSIKWKK
jgi:peroxiredoxin